MKLHACIYVHIHVPQARERGPTMDCAHPQVLFFLMYVGLKFLFERVLTKCTHCTHPLFEPYVKCTAFFVRLQYYACACICVYHILRGILHNLQEFTISTGMLGYSSTVYFTTASVPYYCIIHVCTRQYTILLHATRVHWQFKNAINLVTVSSKHQLSITNS